MHDSTAELLDAVASSAPTPGGGSVSALVGALGAALAAMVFRLTEAKEYGEFAAGEAADLAAGLDSTRAELTVAFDADADSYEQVLTAFRLPKDGDAERRDRAAAIKDAMRNATEVPMATARLCLEVLEGCRAAALKGYDQAVTDAGVGAALAHAAAVGALYNVQINLGSVKDADFVARMAEETSELRARADGLWRETDAAVSEAVAG